MTKKRLKDLCAAASGGGVGFVAKINNDGSITIRRDEEFARSTERTMGEAEAADYLEAEAADFPTKWGIESEGESE